MLLHAAVHATTHVFSHGLKTGWDLSYLLDRGGAAIDWARLQRWVTALRVGRAFWAPVRVLAAELDLPFPAAFLAASPADRRQRQLDVIAQRRLFAAFEGASS